MIKRLTKLPHELQQYLIVTANYWAFTLTDGALRMLVVLHFHSLGYSPLNIALLFLFYEVFGVITNLAGGWLGAHLGLNKTMNTGLALQVLALTMLLAADNNLSVTWVMAAQAISGIAKDLNKMSAKSAIKLLVPDGAPNTLYRWVAILTGSKNTLKGGGFFLGALLLSLVGFQSALMVMTLFLSGVWFLSICCLKKDLGKSKIKVKFTEIFSKSPAINYLSAARMFLFGARDIWFVVALPVYLSTTLGWDPWSVGCFLALWIIAYGTVQSLAPLITGQRCNKAPDGLAATRWATALAVTPALIAVSMSYSNWGLFIGLIIFGGFFAINSSLHSYLIVSYASKDSVSLDVGFYYMANAMGRLIGTVLSGYLFQNYGLTTCLWASSLFIFIAATISSKLPRHEDSATA
jgi:predicted MFS family arabinose efflux permease